MAMTTRCPQCAAAFRVVPDQLRVRSGLVRCGVCSSVFDGYACLVSEEEAAEPMRRNPPAVFRNRADILRERPAADGRDGERDASRDPESERDEDGDARRDGGAPADSHGYSANGGEPYLDDLRAGEAADREPMPSQQRAAEPVLRIPPPSDEAADAFQPWYGADDAGEDQAGTASSGPRVMGEQRHPDEAPVPEFLDEDLQRRRRLYRKLWAIAAIVALAVLALQLLLVYRTAIAAAVPLARPVLSLMCQPLGCSVGYERRAERISIMSSSLQPDGERAAASATASGSVAGKAAGRLVLNVVLRNRYDRPQEWPALMLDLRDVSDTVVVRKALLPQDYLPPGMAGRPFEAGSEISLAVPFEVGAANVNGYQIDKFFP